MVAGQLAACGPGVTNRSDGGGEGGGQDGHASQALSGAITSGDRGTDAVSPAGPAVLTVPSDASAWAGAAAPLGPDDATGWQEVAAGLVHVTVVAQPLDGPSAAGVVAGLAGLRGPEPMDPTPDARGPDARERDVPDTGSAVHRSGDAPPEPQRSVTVPVMIEPDAFVTVLLAESASGLLHVELLVVRGVDQRGGPGTAAAQLVFVGAPGSAAHVVTDGSVHDLRLGLPLVTGVAPGTWSGHLLDAAGALVRSHSGAPLADERVLTVIYTTVDGPTAELVVAAGLAPAEHPEPGQAGLRLYHAAAGIPDVVVYLDCPAGATQESCDDAVERGEALLLGELRPLRPYVPPWDTMMAGSAVVSAYERVSGAVVVDAQPLALRDGSLNLGVLRAGARGATLEVVDEAAGRVDDGIADLLVHSLGGEPGRVVLAPQRGGVVVPAGGAVARPVSTRRPTAWVVRPADPADEQPGSMTPLAVVVWSGIEEQTTVTILAGDDGVVDELIDELPMMVEGSAHLRVVHLGRRLLEASGSPTPRGRVGAQVHARAAAVDAAQEASSSSRNAVREAPVGGASGVGSAPE